METNEKVKKNGILKVIIPLILIITIVVLAGLAYARYVTRLNGQSTADIAQWSFKVNDKTNESFTIDLADTRIKANDEVQMQDGYIGPGTSGAFDIKLDATGSEVSLKYDVNIDVDNANNTKLPKNLVFYSDSTMQNAIYHENNIINLNGFIGVADNSKVHTKTVYWKWAYETGQTQSEINTNDGLDSYWMGKDISIAINVIGKQVNENPTAGEYTVTFDANGGTIQGYGNSSQATKMVTYGETYGTLPTLTREGYTFVGWNGKNLVNISDHNETFVNYYYINKTSKPKYILKPNTTYTLSFDYVVNYSTNKVYSSIGYGTYDYLADIISSETSVSSESGRKVVTATTPNTFNYSPAYVYFRLVRMPTPGDANVDISNVQFEEGSTATAYEPYYLTSSTLVTQNKNHTLTAIWVEN